MNLNKLSQRGRMNGPLQENEGENYAEPPSLDAEDDKAGPFLLFNIVVTNQMLQLVEHQFRRLEDAIIFVHCISFSLEVDAFEKSNGQKS